MLFVSHLAARIDNGTSKLKQLVRQICTQQHVTNWMASPRMLDFRRFVNSVLEILASSHNSSDPTAR
jgi:hypothetical protein